MDRAINDRPDGGGIEAKKGEVDQANAKWDQAQKAVGGRRRMMMMMMMQVVMVR